MFSNGRNIFSIRKLTVGIASVLIGTSLLQAPVLADDSSQSKEVSEKKAEVEISYLAVNEQELTDKEQQLVIKESLAKEKATQTDTYVVVYKAANQGEEKVSVQEKDNKIWSFALAAGGLLLVIYSVKKGKKHIAGIILVGTLTGGVGLDIEARQTITLLAEKGQSYVVGNQLQDLAIEGYEYVGYLRDEDLLANSELKKLVDQFIQEHSKESKDLSSEDSDKDKKDETNDQNKKDTKGKKDEKDSKKLTGQPNTTSGESNKGQSTSQNVGNMLSGIENNQPKEEVKLAPEAPVPEESTPEVPAPEVPSPEEAAPEVPAPEALAPIEPTPEAPAPEESTPEVPAPEVPTPEAPVPEESTPEVPTPEAPVPEESTPEVPAPEVPSPEESTPEAPAPENDLPNNYPTVSSLPVAEVKEVRQVHEIPAPAEEERVENAERYVNEEPKVLFEGQMGERVTITRQIIVEGKVVSEEKVSEAIIRPAQPRRVEYGTKELPDLDKDKDGILDSVEVEMANSAINSANQLIKDYAAQVTEITATVVISPEQRESLELAKKAVQRAIRVANAAIEAVPTARRQEVQLFSPAALPEVPEVTDSDADGTVDTLEVANANVAIEEAQNKIEAYNAALAKVGKAVSPEMVETLTQAKEAAKIAIEKAKAVKMDVPEAKQTEVTAFVPEALADIPSVNDLDSDNQVDAAEINKANAVIEEATRLTNTYKEALRVAKAKASLSATEIQDLETAKQAAEAAIEKAKAAKADVPQARQGEVTPFTPETLESLSTATDTDGDGKADAAEVETANAAIAEATRLIEAYQAALAEAQNDNVMSATEAEKLEAAKLEAQQAIDKAKAAKADVPQDKQKELNEFNPKELEAVPTVDDTDNDDKADDQEVVDADSAIDEAKRLIKEYQDLLEAMKRETTISPEDVQHATELKANVEKAITEANKAKEDVPVAKQGEVKLFETVELEKVPEVNDLDDDGLNDEDEVSQAETTIAEANKLIQAYQAALEEAKSDEALSPKEAQALQEKKEAAEQAIVAANKAKEGIPNSKQEGLTALTATTLEAVPTVTDEDGDDKADATEVREANDEITKANELIAAYNAALQAAGSAISETEAQNLLNAKAAAAAAIEKAKKAKANVPAAKANEVTPFEPAALAAAPSANDSDNDDKVDAAEVIDANEKIDEAARLIDAYKEALARAGQAISEAEAQSLANARQAAVDAITAANQAKEGIPANKVTEVKGFNPEALTAAPIMNDVDDDSKIDAEEVRTANAKVTEANDLIREYQEALAAVTSETALSPTEVQALQSKKEVAEQAIASAKTVKSDVPTTKQGDVQALTAETLANVPEVNDLDADDQIDAKEIEVANTVVEKANRLSRAYQAEIDRITSNTILSQEDVVRLTQAREAAEQAINEAKAAKEAVPEAKRTSVKALEKEILPPVPTANDMDSDGKADDVEVREANDAIATAQRLAQEYAQKLTEATVNRAITAEEHRTLSEAKKAAEQAIREATAKKEGVPQSKQNELTEFTVPTLASVPVINDLDDDAKIDDDEVANANTKIAEANSLIQEYQAKLATAKTNGVITPTEFADLTQARTKVEEAIAKANEAKNDVPTAKQTGLRVPPMVEAVPQVTDLDDDGTADDEEVRLANEAAETANRLIQEYENLLTTTQADGTVSPTDEQSLREKKAEAERAINEANAKKEGVPTPKKETVTALTKAELAEVPAVNDLDDDKKLDNDEVSKANEKVKTANDLIAEYNTALGNARNDNKITKDEHNNLKEKHRQVLESIAEANRLKEDVPQSRQPDVDALTSETVEDVPPITEEETEKFIEFRRVSTHELYKVEADGTMTRVTGLTVAPSDNEKVNYIVRLVNDDREFLLPVASIAESEGKFKVTVQHPRLRTFRSADTDFVEDYHFTVDKTKTGPGIYTDFNELIAAMKRDSRGTFKIGADMIATSTNDVAYVPNFSGTLTSVDGQKYAIIGTNKPLINTLAGGTVSNIKLKNVNVNSQDSTATVALMAKDGAVVSKVDVTGKLTYRSGNTNSHYIGGLVSGAVGATIERNSVDLTFDIGPKRYNNISGIVSRASGATIRENYVTGNMNVSNAEPATVVAVLATGGASIIQDNISNLTVPLEGQYVFGATNKQIRDGKNGTITREDADAKLRQWGMLAEETSASTSDTPTAVAPNYGALPDYDQRRAVAYRNTEKLLPLYDRKTIIRYGNLIAEGSHLYTKEIKAIVPMKDKQFKHTHANDVNQLLIKYDDGTTETLAITATGQYEGTGVEEYRLQDNLLYTPNSLHDAQNDFIGTLADKLNPLTLDSAKMQEIVKLAAYNQYYIDRHSDYRATMKELYLDKSVEEVKAHLNTHLDEMIKTTVTGDFTNEAVKRAFAKRVEDNKEKLLLGLSYLNRFYDVKFGEYSIKDLMLYRPDFYNKNQTSFDWLTRTGGQSFEALIPYNNEDAFNKHMASDLGSNNLINFLDKNRQMFTPSMTASEWFKDATKAFIHEEASKVVPNQSVDVYERLQAKETYKSYILPLLTLDDDDVYVATTASSIFFGGYGRSVDVKTKTTNPEAYRAAVAKVHDEVRKAAQRWRAYNDFYWKISDENERQILLRTYSDIYDGYYIRDETGEDLAQYGLEGKRRWADRYDREYSAVYDFFGPVGRWYDASSQKNSAYAIRENKRVHFDSVDILGPQGGATLNHELVHTYDEDVLLRGHKYRDGQNTESYAYGLFESVSSASSYYYGFNFMYDIKGGPYNHNIDQFTDRQALQDYAKHLSDATYLLDGIEADIVLNKSSAEKVYLLNQINLVKEGPTSNGANHGVDRISTLTAEQIERMNLRTIDDLIHHNLVSKTSLMGAKDYYRDNQRNYYIVPLYYPIYAGYQNSTGTVGGLMFRRVAFDMLAEFGWDEGFVPYASNKYKSFADGQGVPLSDNIVFGAIFNAKYTSYEDFKIKMFKQRMDKKDQFKAININGRNITTSAELRSLMEVAINDDLAKAKQGQVGFAKQNLKAQILAAFNAQTDGFRGSIFKDQPGENP